MAKNIDADLKRQYLRTLKKKGLYSGQIKRTGEVSRYQEKILSSYADVLRGKAKVTTLPKRGATKGENAAKKIAADLAEKYSSVVRSKGRRIITRVTSPSDKVTYSIAEGTLGIRHKFGEQVVTHELRTKEGKLPDLQEGETYGLPFSRGKDGIEWHYRATKEEIEELAAEYEHASKMVRHADGTYHRVETPYVNAPEYIAVVYPGRKKRKPKKKQPKKVKASNVIPFPGKKR